MSDDEIRQLIIHAISPQTVEHCCEQVHQQSRMLMVPLQVKNAVERGFVTCLSGEIVDSARIYTARIQLTDSGCTFCGVTSKPKKSNYLF